MSRRVRTKRLARAAVPFAAAGVLAAGFAGVAGAQGPGGANAEAGKARAAAFFGSLSPEQKDCLVAHGAKRPEGRPSPADRRALVRAASACDITVARPSNAGRQPGRTAGEAAVKLRFATLTQAQKVCLVAQGVKRPDGRPSRAAKQALRAAAAACGIQVGGPSR